MLLSLTFALVHVSIVPALRTDGPASTSAAAAETSGPVAPGVRAGFWWEDYDRDGLPDAFTIASNGAARLLHNQGDGTFADVTLISGLDALKTASFAAWYDFDRDGVPDLFVGTQSGPGRLLRNAHDGTFQDVTEFVGLATSSHALEAQWLDYDLDGLSDLALRTDTGEELYRALPNGLFEGVDLGLARSLADISVGLSYTEDVDAAARESTGIDSPAGRMLTKHRRPKLAGAALPFTPSGSTPIPPNWSNSGAPNANLATCVDLIQNRATGLCIQVSSTPTLGLLYPLTTNLNVSLAGNVGIGTTSPAFKLDVAGTARITNTLTLNPGSDQALDVSTGSIYKGGALFIHTKGGISNTSLGLFALKNVTTGASNSASGYLALYSNTAGSGNTANGNAALKSNTTGSSNTANGNAALESNTTGFSNTASGYEALKYNTTAFGNTASGHGALRSNTTGVLNTASGAGALNRNTTGSKNTASGYGALASNTTGENNTASGYLALLANTTGNKNTAAGYMALLSNRTGSGNTANGHQALVKNTTGYSNTASGSRALYLNSTGNLNTASGVFALFTNSSGSHNTADGAAALYFNTTGNYNTANGNGALNFNNVGNSNTADGAQALYFNTTGFRNTAVGYRALFANSSGTRNTAVGDRVLYANTTGYKNTASGQQALSANTVGAKNFAGGYKSLLANTTGSNNIALGTYAGSNLTTGSNNIEIGNAGVAAEAGTTRVGTSGMQTRAFIVGIRGVTTGTANAIPVLIDSKGQLGTVSSSRRFKKDIRDMGDATSRLLELRPVMFKYKQEQTMPDGSEVPPEYGLIAEEVAEIMPDLVVYDDEGKPFTVKYHVLSSMLLNEMKKQDERFKEQSVARESQARELQDLRTRFAALEARVGSTASSADGR